MTEDNVATQEELPKLVDRLARASVRRKSLWSDVLGREMWTGRDSIRTLGEWDPVRSTCVYRRYRQEPEVALSLQRTLAFYAVGVDLELILRNGLTNLAATLPASHPAHGFIAHELREEAEHSDMFRWFADVAGSGYERHTSISEHEIDRISSLGGEAPAVFLLYVVCGELMFDRVQRAAVASDDTHPLVARIDRYHCVEEARHLSFGRGLLRDLLRSENDKLHKRLTYEAPIVARWTSARVIDMPRSLYRELGATDDEVVDARDSIRRSDLHQRCMSDLYRLCASVGLVDDRLRGAWGAARPQEDL